MPSIEISSGSKDLQLHLWEIEEGLSFFTREISFTSDEDLEFDSLMGKRQVEFAVQRFLLNRALKGLSPLMKKTKNGKPYLANLKQKISISHSKSMLILSVGKEDHGVDLEWIDGRITRLASKFCNNAELITPDYTDEIFWYTLIWSCKESLYKVDGLGQLEFRTQLAVHFTPESFRQGWGRGVVKRPEGEHYFRLYFREVNGFIISWAYPKMIINNLSFARE